MRAAGSEAGMRYAAKSVKRAQQTITFTHLHTLALSRTVFVRRVSSQCADSSCHQTVAFGAQNLSAHISSAVGAEKKAGVAVGRGTGSGGLTIGTNGAVAGNATESEFLR
jgi:hypothetical protein